MTPETKMTLEDRIAQIRRDAESGGYHLNPDDTFVRVLVEGILKNEDRYGYPSCPCRLATGERARDLDIICPCNYRDADISEFGACYCSLYVREDIAAGKPLAGPVPERRPPHRMPASLVRTDTQETPFKLSWPIWRCSVCGYLCARASPPDRCPICKVAGERFERFL